MPTTQLARADQPIADAPGRNGPVFAVPEGSACACCSDGFHRPAEGAGGGTSSAATDHPSLDWDGAAEQIGRSGVTWSATPSSTSGISFGGGMGEAARVTYGFLAEEDVSDDGGRAYRAMTADEIAMTEYAMTLIAEVANIEFVRVAGADGVYLDDPADAQIDLDAMDATNAGLARTSWSGDTYRAATISIGERGLEDLGSYAFRTAIHEVAHAVGLSHPGRYDGSARYATDAEYREDSAQFTVMSYFDETVTGADYGWAYSTNLMLHDVAALQRLYGANDQTRAGDTVYGFGSNTNDLGWTLDGADHEVIGAIWDGGGHDRLDLSGYAGDQRIDLGEEAFSDVGTLEGNVAIARGVVIEDAAGGAGDDEVVGNAADNTLAGGAGSDLLLGGAGDDVLYGDGGPADWHG